LKISILMVLTVALVLLALAHPAQAWSKDTNSVSDNRVEIDVDASGNVGWIRSLQGVNGGPFPLGSDIVPLYEQYRQIGVDFVRTHDDHLAFDIGVVFPNMKADPSREASYDFGSTDSEVQGIISVGAQILYRLGYSGGESSEVPTDYAQFAEICKHIVMHYNQGWANGFQYGIRYWEIWNEPNMGDFWKGTPEQYFELYDTVARTLKAADSEIRVGGPAVILGRVFVLEFLEFCRANKSPLDFLSWHIYPENQPYLVAEAALQIQDLLRRYGFENIENFITEWNFSASGSSAELSNARGASWASSVLVYLQDTSVSRAFWYRGSGSNASLFLGNGDFKKSGYAFLAMKKMLETPLRLACSGSDKAGFATLAGRSEDNHALRVLISNYDSGYGEFALTVKNWDSSVGSVQVEIYVLNDTYDLALIDQFQLTKAEPLTITSQIAPSSVYLISFEAKQVTTETTTQQTVTETTTTQQEPMLTTQATATTTTQVGSEDGIDFAFTAIGIGAVTVAGVGVAAGSRQRSEVFVHAGYYYCRKHRVPALDAQGRLWCPVEQRYLRA
jgi:xylan 1,4-beta-xylosidase